MALSNCDSFERNGLILYRNLLPGDLIAALHAQIDSKYDQIESARRAGGFVNDIVGTTERFVPTASSLTVGAAISEKTLRLVLAQIAEAPTGAWIKNELESHVVCDLDQSWVRRQYAPANYPRFHAPHGWHQDGALKFDFAAHQPAHS